MASKWIFWMYITQTGLDWIDYPFVYPNFCYLEQWIWLLNNIEAISWPAIMFKYGFLVLVHSVRLALYLIRLLLLVRWLAVTYAGKGGRKKDGGSGYMWSA